MRKFLFWIEYIQSINFHKIYIWLLNNLWNISIIKKFKIWMISWISCLNNCKLKLVSLFMNILIKILVFSKEGQTHLLLGSVHFWNHKFNSKTHIYILKEMIFYACISWKVEHAVMSFLVIQTSNTLSLLRVAILESLTLLQVCLISNQMWILKNGSSIKINLKGFLL